MSNKPLGEFFNGGLGAKPEGLSDKGFGKVLQEPPRIQQDTGLRMILKRTRYTAKGVLGNPLRFQIAPLDEFGWDANFSWVDYDTINGGQYTRRGGRQLRQLTISTLSVDWSAPWAVIQHGHNENPRNNEDYYGSAGGPWKLAKRLDQLVTQGTPMLLIVKNPELYKQADINMNVTLRSVGIRERAGEPDARYFELTFVEYRTPQIQRKAYGDRHELPAMVEINENGMAVEKARGVGMSYIDEDLHDYGKKFHHIGSSKRPATLRSLAKHYYGSPNQWTLIKKKNAPNHSAVARLSGDDPLTELFDKRKRKKQPVRLIIPMDDRAKKERQAEKKKEKKEKQRQKKKKQNA